MRNLSLVTCLLILALATGCNRKKLQKENLVGYVQKGPFTSGTAVFVFELDKDFQQTGNTYNTPILNNSGSFGISTLDLKTDYALFQAYGFYFNEVIGEISESSINLSALSDLSDREEVNLNPITYLERARVEYLLGLDSTFAAAKTTAQAEILNIFGISRPANMLDSEGLDISYPGDDNAILLAISVILQGYRGEGEMMQLMADISQDLSTDGTLDNSALGSALMNHAVSLNTSKIRDNLIQRYNSVGLAINVPTFENYLDTFLLNAPYPITGTVIEYPATGQYGTNILVPEDTVFTAGSHSLAAGLPRGTDLSVKISLISGTPWNILVGSESNWSIQSYNPATNSQILTASNDDNDADLNINFDPGSYRVEYFEMESGVPVRTKTITVQ